MDDLDEAALRRTIEDFMAGSAPLIATLRTLREFAGEQNKPILESVLVEDQKTVRRYEDVLQKLEQETNKTSRNVLIAINDKDASVLQSRIAEGGEVGPPLPAGGVEAQFGDGLTGGDVWGWIRSVFDHIDQSQWHAIVRPPDTKVGSLADTGRIAVIGDWGTNLYGAPVSAASIGRTGSYEMVMHLGDIYYSGTETETKQRFLDVWPVDAGRVSRALNGNHEMYSGGFAYFDHILPTFKQPSSYFAVQNAHWLLIGLDSAHTDHALDKQQVEWLNAVVKGIGQRKLILFSHHQPFSRLDQQGPNLVSALSELLRNRLITVWYWGHEHSCVLYDEHSAFRLLGRCIGHGGIPEPRKSEVTGAPIDRAVNDITWRRLSATTDSPPCLVLDGRNPLVPGEEDKFSPHGYLTLEFNGPELIERVHLPAGTEIFQSRVV
jgi:Calcineurin-like phosphoesterase